MKTIKARRSYGVAAVYVTIGLILVLTGVGVQWRLNQAVADAVGSNVAITPYVPPKSAPELISSVPKHISIPSVDIDVSVVPGQYDKDYFTWTLADNAAVYADISAPLNNLSGNTYIYGHNKRSVFRSLLQIPDGSKAYVRGEDNRIYSYELVRTSVIDPTDMTVLDQTDKPTLTLQTCSGSWYQHRSIFTFRFLGVSK